MPLPRKLAIVGCLVLALATTVFAADQSKVKQSASAIQIELTTAGDTRIPNEFRYAIYEEVVDHVEKSNTFRNVYRTGDRRATEAGDLVTLRTTVDKFKEGNQAARELTTVLGWTKVDVIVVMTNKDGKPLLEKRVTGKVRFRGDNLKVTDDLGKRIAKLLGENFVAK